MVSTARASPACRARASRNGRLNSYRTCPVSQLILSHQTRQRCLHFRSEFLVEINYRCVGERSLIFDYSVSG